MNTLTYKELKQYYIENEIAVENAKNYFGDRQPSIYRTGFYSSPSWNWGYLIGIVGVEENGQTKWFEVVTQFGGVVAARWINLPQMAKE